MTGEDFTQDLAALTELTHSAAAPAASTAVAASAPRSLQMVKLLGRGRLGEVWRAERPDTGQTLALKFVHPPGGADASAYQAHVEKILEPILALDSHPHLAPITDVEFYHDPPFLLMPHYEGSLGRLARQQRHHKLEGLVRRWIMEASSALEFLHHRGLFHGNLHPENFLVDKEGNIRLSDFGLTGLCPSGQAGMYYFMSPEQSGQPLGRSPVKTQVACDIYALGATFYYVLTGEYPRGSQAGMKQLREAPDELRRSQAYQHQLRVVPLKPILKIKPGLDRCLCRVIETCLSLDPAQRFASAGDIIRQLESSARHREYKSLIVRWSLSKFKRWACTASVLLQCLTLAGLSRAVWRQDGPDIEKWAWWAVLVLPLFVFTYIQVARDRD